MVSRLVWAGAAAIGTAAQAQQPADQPGAAPAAPTTPLPASPPSTAPPPAEREVSVELHLRTELGFERDFSDAPGDVSTFRGGVGVDVGIPIKQYSQLTLGVDFEHSNYDFHGATGFVAGTTSPFDTIERTTFKARFAQHLSQEWQYFVGGSLALSYEEGADVGESITGILYAAPKYAFSEDLSIGVGLAVGTRLEDNALLLPLVVFDWKFAEEWTLTNEGKLGLTLRYTPSDLWTFSLGASYEYRDFRLDESGRIPGGVGRDTWVPVSLTATYTPTPRLTVGAGLGVYAAQSIEVLDAAGNSIADLDAEPGLFLTFNVGFRF